MSKELRLLGNNGNIELESPVNITLRTLFIFTAAIAALCLWLKHITPQMEFYSFHIIAEHILIFLLALAAGAAFAMCYKPKSAES